jgi:hypothetical protein
MEYYNLNQLLTNNKTDLKLRQLKNRIKLVNNLVTDNKLLCKNGRTWQIHKSIIKLFQSTWINKKGLRTEITINLADNYDTDYYVGIATDIARIEPNKMLMYSIEENFTQKKHIHIATSMTYKQSKRVLIQLDKQRDYVILSNKNTHIAHIENVIDYIAYISKEVDPTLLNA